MIRKWSHINNINLKFKNSFLIKKKFRLNIFKKSVSLKRFQKKYTKFRRKAFVKLKHNTSLTLYNNIFKYWSYDYFKIKHCIKNQIISHIFQNNILFFNCNFVLNKNLNIFCNWNFLYFNFAKKSFNFFYKTPNIFIPNSPFTQGWYLSSTIVESDNLAFPAYSTWDNLFYSVDITNHTFNITHLFNYFLNHTLIKLKEIYKFLLILYLI